MGLIVAAGARAETDDYPLFDPALHDPQKVSVEQRHEQLEWLTYDAIEARGLGEWQRSDLSDRERAELAIDLARAYTDHALTSPRDERDALWARAESVCAALAGGWPDNPRRPLVETQRALVQLARGEQLRDEAEGTPDQAAGYAQAAEQIRAAVRRLVDVADSTHKQLIQLRLHPPARPAADALTVSELEALEANLAYRLARAQRQLGLLYPAGSADRDDGLLRAVGRLEPIAQRTSADELVWKARLELLACLRDLRRLNAAHQRLAAWSAADPPPQVAALLATERVRLLMAEGRPAEANHVASAEIRARAASRAVPPELMLAQLEAALAARTQGQASGTLASDNEQWNDEVTNIGKVFGPYWQRRAELLVSRATGGSPSSGGVSSGPLAAAATLYHEGKAAEAVAAYDRAVVELDQTGQTDGAVEAAMAAAAIVREAGDVAEATRRYHALAASHPGHPRAPEAHRLAILCVTDRMRTAAPADRAPLMAQYEALLREHLTAWPEAATTDQVRWWLGRLLAAGHDWSAARQVLQQIPPANAHFPAAAQLVAECYEHELRTVAQRDAERRATLLTAATQYLQPIITGPRNRWPDTWSELQLATAASLARLHLAYGDDPPDYAERLLAAAMRGAAAAPDGATWQQSVRPLLVVALVRSGKLSEARSELALSASAPPATLIEVVDLLDGQLDREAAGRQQAIGQLMLDAIQSLSARRNQLDAEASARLNRQYAAALAAVGERDAALEQLRRLAAQRPNDGQLQEDYAALLAEGGTTDALREALAAWQKIEARSHRGGPRWIRARQARIELLGRLGERQEAEKLLQLTRLLYPDWDRRAR